MAKGNPTDIRGNIYNSQSEAAEVLGVAPTTISAALRNGTTDTVGFRGGNPVRLDGVEYPSQKAMCRAHGLNVAHTNARIRKARKNGRNFTMTRVGLVEWG